MAKYHGITISHSQAALADSETTSDQYADGTVYFDVTSGDPGSATLYSVGSTDTAFTTINQQSIPSDLVASGPQNSLDGAAISVAWDETAAKYEVAYNVLSLHRTSYDPDQLAAGASETDKFYYAIQMAGGTLSYNVVAVAINGLAASIQFDQQNLVGLDDPSKGFVTEAFDWHPISVPDNSAQAETNGVAIYAYAASGNDTAVAVTADSGDWGAMTAVIGPNAAGFNAALGTFTAAGTSTDGGGNDFWQYTYSVLDSTIYANSAAGYGEVAHTDTFTVTTANGTPATLTEVIYGNIHAPDVTAAAASDSIVAGASVGLTISASDHDDNASLTYTVTLTGDTDATLSSATDEADISHAGNVWTVGAGALADLTLTPTAGYTGDIGIDVAVINTETAPDASIAIAETDMQLSVTVTPAASTFTWVTLDFPEASSTLAAAINGSGEVAGTYIDGSGEQHGFVYNAGAYMSLELQGAVLTRAQAINGSGEVAGTYIDGNGEQHGFSYNAGTFTPLDVPGANQTDAFAINSSGEVAGVDNDGFGEHGFLYNAGAYVQFDAPGAFETDVFAINASGEVAGTYMDATDHGFVYNAGTLTPVDPPGAIFTEAEAINADGEVVGTYQDGDGEQHAFLYNAGFYTQLDAPGASVTVATAINDAGTVAGVYQDRVGRHGFVYANGIFTTLDNSSASASAEFATTALSINSSGEVAGFFVSSGSVHGFLAIPS